MVISGVVSPEETSARQGNQPQQHRSSAPRHDASISALLNDKQTQKLQYQQQEEQQQQNHHEDYLPTPVTPATSFPVLPPSLSSSSFSHPIEASVSPLPPTHATKTMMTKANSISSPQEYPTPSVQYQKQEQQQQGRRRTSTEKTPSTSSVDKPYACTHCNQTFSRPHNLKSHLTTHSSERPFQCDICKNYFRRHHDLKRHRKLHTGERPYSCNVCHRSFARLDALNRHCRAEGGTACSSVHRVQGRRTIASITSSRTTTTTTTSISSTSHSSHNGQRPIIPQLHIAHPATQPIANEVYPYPPINNSIIPHPTATSDASTSTNTNTTTTSMPNDNNSQHHNPAASMTTPAASPQPLSTRSTSNITASYQSTSSASSSSSSSSPSSSAKRVRDHLLPSPSALSQLPVSESRDLVPIQKLHTEMVDHEKTTSGSAYEVSTSSSSPPPPPHSHTPTYAGPLPPPPPSSSSSSSVAVATTTTTPPPNSQHHPTPPPYYGWIPPSSGRDNRTLPLPNRYPGNSSGNYGNSNTASGGERAGESSWERLRHENHELRQELAYWQTSAEELNTLKSRLHDLQVENKVLRSLITESSSPDEEHNQTKRKLLPCQIKEDEAAYKRRNLSNL